MRRVSPSRISPSKECPGFYLKRSLKVYSKVSRLFSSLALILALLVFWGCGRDAKNGVAGSPPPEVPPPGATRSGPLPSANRLPPPPPPAELWKAFSGEKAMEEVKKQIAIGPRASGQTEIEKARKLIVDGLAERGWDVTRQEFTDATPRGPIQFVNIIGRFSPSGSHPAPSNTQTGIICSHYDTKRYSTIKFVGASDGASSTGALLELARVLALDPALAAKVELVFFDGEEAIQNFTSVLATENNDGLWGSRHYAHDLERSGRAKQFKFAILWDMIGDKDLTITLSPDSPRSLAAATFASAKALGYEKHFTYFSRDILDDHVPLSTFARIPSIDLIDFDYLYWHTQDDTLDKLSPESLQIVGEVTLHMLRQGLLK